MDRRTRKKVLKREETMGARSRGGRRGPATPHRPSPAWHPRRPPREVCPKRPRRRTPGSHPGPSGSSVCQRCCSVQSILQDRVPARDPHRSALHHGLGISSDAAALLPDRPSAASEPGVPPRSLWPSPQRATSASSAQTWISVASCVWPV